MFQVVFSSAAAEDLSNLDATISERIIGKLEYFSALPDPAALAVGLVGYPGRFRYRVGDWRIIVRFDRVARTIVVLRVAHRREIYDL